MSGNCGCGQCAMMYWGCCGTWKALRILNCVQYVLKGSTQYLRVVLDTCTLQGW